MKDNVYASKHTTVYTSKQDNQIPIDLNTLSEETTTISFRIPVTHKVLYKKMSTTQKAMFRIAVIKLLESIAKNKNETNSPIIINMNINMNNNTASANVENNVTFNLSLKETLEELFRWLDRLASPVSQYSTSVPPFVRSDAAKYRARVARLLREVN